MQDETLQGFLCRIKLFGFLKQDETFFQNIVQNVSFFLMQVKTFRISHAGWDFCLKRLQKEREGLKNGVGATTLHFYCSKKTGEGGILGILHQKQGEEGIILWN